jgi:hypothetical protein
VEESRYDACEVARACYEHEGQGRNRAMFDDKGKQIGVWYSILEAKTYLKMKDSNTVIIDTPDIDTWLQFEDGSRRHMK